MYGKPTNHALVQKTMSLMFGDMYPAFIAAYSRVGNVAVGFVLSEAGKGLSASVETIAALCPAWGPSLLGDKMYSVVFDNTKIKRVVPGFHAQVSFREGVRRALAWYNADPVRRCADPEVDQRMDAIIAACSVWRPS